MIFVSLQCVHCSCRGFNVSELDERIDVHVAKSEESRLPVPHAFESVFSSWVGCLSNEDDFSRRVSHSHSVKIASKKIARRAMSALKKLSLLKQKIRAGHLELTDEVVEELLFLESELTEDRESEEGSGAYFEDMLTYIFSLFSLSLFICFPLILRIQSFQPTMHG